MSERPIQVGDLVQVVRWPCCGRYLGNIFKVEEISSSDSALCFECGARSGPSGFYAAPEKYNRGAPVSWLKRIPPLEELEGQRTEEGIKEPNTSNLHPVMEMALAPWRPK